jgi:hypothetical protein
VSDIFKLGQEASRSVFVAALQALQAQGTGVIQTLENARIASLVEFDRRVQAVNGRRVRSWRVQSPEQAVKFVVSDFTDIDQASTTGTVRADSSSVSLKERAVPAEAVIKTKKFSVNTGTIEALDAAQNILRVHTDDFSTPTGQFDIELVQPLTLNQFIIDIVASPSSPVIVVTVSQDGLTYTPATQVAINGYRVNVWLPSTETRYIRLQITPSHPDDLNGNTFTFGITNFSAQATDYHLRSEWLSKKLQFTPKSEFIVFDAPVDSQIQYYLSVYPTGTAQAPFVEINPGDLVQIGTLVSSTTVTSPSLPSTLGNLPLDVYVNTISVKENGVSLSRAPSLTQSDPLLTQLQHEYVGLALTSVNYVLELVRGDGNYNPPRTFAISYVHGPALVTIQLKVRLNTDDRATSPVFRGAILDEV